MTPGADHIARARSGLLGLTGLCCLLYAGLAFAQDRPDPMYWWIPGAFGATSAVLIAVLSVWAGARQAGMAADELYHNLNRKAQAQAYWLSLALFVGVTLLAAQSVIAFRTGFAVLGTLMGAAYLFLFVWHDWRSG